jgi:hypothetical protein
MRQLQLQAKSSPDQTQQFRCRYSLLGVPGIRPQKSGDLMINCLPTTRPHNAFHQTYSLTRTSSQKKIGGRKTTFRCAVFGDSFLWAVTEWFQQKDPAGMWRRSKVLQGDDNDSSHHDGASK